MNAQDLIDDHVIVDLCVYENIVYWSNLSQLALHNTRGYYKLADLSIHNGCCFVIVVVAIFVWSASLKARWFCNVTFDLLPINQIKVS